MDKSQEANHLLEEHRLESSEHSRDTETLRHDQNCIRNSKIHLVFLYVALGATLLGLLSTIFRTNDPSLGFYCQSYHHCAYGTSLMTFSAGKRCRPLGEKSFLRQHWTNIAISRAS